MTRVFWWGAIVIIAIVGIMWVNRLRYEGELRRGSWVLLDSPLPFVTFTPTPTPTAQEAAQQYIYAAMIDNAPAPFTEEALARVAIKTWIWDMDAVVPYEVIAERVPTLSRAAWQGFLEANRETTALPVFDMVVTRPVQWESIERLKIDFGDQRRSWDSYLENDHFRDGDPRADLENVGLLMLSNTFFDAETNQTYAILRIGCGAECSQGVLFRFELTETGWSAPHQTVLWDTLPPDQTTFPVSLLPTITPTVPPTLSLQPTPLPVSFDAIEDQSRWDHEKRVLRAFENSACTFPSATFVLSATTIPYADESADVFGTLGPQDPDGYLLWFQDEMPALRSDTWEDFVAMNRLAYAIPDDLAFVRNTYVGGDVPTREQPACGKVSVSRVGFNQDGTQALLYYEYFCGTWCWGSYMMLLEQSPTGWQEVDALQIGIS